MSWHFSQALEAAYSAGNSSDGAPSAPSSGTPTHGTFWSPGKTTDASTRARSGMTFRPSTDTHGEGLLTWFLEDSRARTSPPPEKGQASPASDPACGSTWRESSAKYCRASSSWKTHRCLWEEDLPSSSLILPKWGMMRSGVLWERTTPEHLTSGTESGSSQNFPTPYGLSASQGQGDGEFGKAIRNWPTPTRNDSIGAGYQRSNGKHFFTLPGAVGATKHLPPEMEEKRMRTWPTPTVSDTGKNPTARQGGENLSVAVQTFPTPRAEDSQCAGGHRGKDDTLYGMICKPKDGSVDAGGQLNPTWVEWLMGWPLGWTDCAASATDRFREWCRSHGICSGTDG